MSGLHAFWSLGVLFGSLITSLFLEWNIGFIENIIMFIVILFPLNLIFASSLEKDEKSYKDEKKNIFFIWPLIIFLLVIISMANALTEGSVDSWGALYMRDYIGVEGFRIGIATVTFNIFMVIGRLTGDWFKDKLGVYNLILILFIFTILGLIILISYDSVYSSLIGFAMLGAGTSSIIPVAYSLAG